MRGYKKPNHTINTSYLTDWLLRVVCNEELLFTAMCDLQDTLELGIAIPQPNRVQCHQDRILVASINFLSQFTTHQTSVDVAQKTFTSI